MKLNEHDKEALRHLAGRVTNASRWAPGTKNWRMRRTNALWDTLNWNHNYIVEFWEEMEDWLDGCGLELVWQESGTKLEAAS